MMLVGEHYVAIMYLTDVHKTFTEIKYLSVTIISTKLLSYPRS